MELYCCDEESLYKIQDAQAQMRALPAGTKVDVSASAFAPSELGWARVPPIAQMSGDMAVVKVSGMLVNGSAGIGRLFGLIGYEEIKAAMIESASRADVNGILVYYDTPGGAVNGVKATAELMAEIRKFKPTVGYAAQAASAGYWLASASGRLFADELSVLGSIGSIMQTEDRTKMNEMQGIKKHVFKSGTLKMAGNPNEELSDEAKAHFKLIIDDMTTVFYNNIAAYRGKKPEKMREMYGDGRAVLGMRALAGGLIDGLGGVNAAIADLQKQISAARKPKSAQIAGRVT